MQSFLLPGLPFFIAAGVVLIIGLFSAHSRRSAEKPIIIVTATAFLLLMFAGFAMTLARLWGS